MITSEEREKYRGKEKNAMIKFEKYINNKYTYHNGIVIVCEDDFEEISKDLGYTEKQVLNRIRKLNCRVIWTKKHSFASNEDIQDSDNFKLMMVQTLPKVIQGRSVRENTGTLWSEIRKSELEIKKCTCEICGYHSANTRDFDIHENYTLDLEKGTIIMCSIQLLCKHCHSFQHCIFEYFKNEDNSNRNKFTLVRHFMAINNCNFATYCAIKKEKTLNRVQPDFDRIAGRMTDEAVFLEKMYSIKTWYYEIAEEVFYKNEIEDKLKEKGLLYGFVGDGIKKKIRNIPCSFVIVTFKIKDEKKDFDKINEIYDSIKKRTMGELIEEIKENLIKPIEFVSEGINLIYGYVLMQTGPKLTKLKKLEEKGYYIAYVGDGGNSKELINCLALYLELNPMSADGIDFYHRSNAEGRDYSETSFRYVCYYMNFHECFFKDVFYYTMSFQSNDTIEEIYMLFGMTDDWKDLRADLLKHKYCIDE